MAERMTEFERGVRAAAAEIDKYVGMISCEKATALILALLPPTASAGDLVADCGCSCGEDGIPAHEFECQPCPNTPAGDREAVDLHDFVTHRDAWLNAFDIVIAQAAQAQPDLDDKGYWQHEKAVFIRALDALSRARTGSEAQNG